MATTIAISVNTKYIIVAGSHIYRVICAAIRAWLSACSFCSIAFSTDSHLLTVNTNMSSAIRCP